ncbi:MAG: tRNA (guanosine(46)-N7)-methyltransferase TrmB [Clostridia bacterium]|nr:tRNA (guanosine(46)-N7)-methyltransferase TrmB [Clostridia bacterium]
MRMRKKKWALPELEACPWALTEDCDRFRGRWRSLFPREQPLHIELGCGKGVSTSEMAWAERNVNFVAIDISSDVLAVARRNIVARYGDAPVENIRLAIKECTFIEKAFAPEDGVERIYISFCNPWGQRDRHKKRRLTHPRQLMQYRSFLADGGEIWFKTDDDGLFADSLDYFAQCGFVIRYITRDLHASGFSPNYVSEHEKMFTEQGVKTKFLIAVKGTLETPPDLTKRK